jgi:hypothetical protein
MRTAVSKSNRHWRGLPRRRAWAPILAIMALTAACAGEAEPGLGGVAVTTTIPTTTIPAETTTTIDFARPIVEGTDPLGIEAEPADVADLVDDLRGQTENVSRQMARLGPFPWLAGPPVAQIVDIDVALEPENEDGLHRSTISVRYRVPDALPTADEFLFNSFKAQGWNRLDESERAEDEATIREIRYIQFGVQDEEVTARIESRPGVTFIDLSHEVLADGPAATPDESGTYFERLSAWAENLPVPRAAVPVSAGVTATDDTGRLALRYRLAAADEETAVAAVLARIGGEGYQLSGVPEGERPVTGPLTLVDEAGTIVVIEFTEDALDATFELDLSTTFELTPLS